MREVARDQLFVVDNYPDVVRVLRDTSGFLQWDGRPQSLFSTESGHGAGMANPAMQSEARPDQGPFTFAHTLPELDPPEHTVLKDLIQRSWRPGATARALRPRVRELARQLLQGHDRRPFDFVAEVALPVSCSTLAWFFGDEPRRWLQLARQHPALWAPEAPRDDALARARDFQVGTWRLLQAGKRCAHEDATGRMIRSRNEAGRRLSDAEILKTILEVAFIPNNLTVHLLGEVTAQVLDDLRLSNCKRNGTAHARDVVNRTVWLRPPLRRVLRRTAKPVVLHGKQLRANCGISVRLDLAGDGHGYGSVHPGPARAPADLRYPQVAFGVGQHFCPGAALAMMQAEVVAEVLCAPARPFRVAREGCIRDADEFMYGPRALWLETYGQCGTTMRFAGDGS